MIRQRPNGVVRNFDVILDAQTVEADLRVDAAVESRAEMLLNAAQQDRLVVLSILWVFPECVRRQGLPRPNGTRCIASIVLQSCLCIPDDFIGLLEFAKD